MKFLEEVEEHKTRVLVRTPCTCGAKRWFSCHCAEDIAEYLCYTSAPMRPSPQDLDYIWKKHPGMTLIY